MTFQANNQAGLFQAETSFSKLSAMIDQLTPEQEQQPFAFEGRDRNIRDVLVHLHEWHRLFLNWFEDTHVHQQPTDFLPIPYTPKTRADMNTQIRNRHQQTTLNEAKAMVHESHTTIMAVASELSHQALMSRRYDNGAENQSISHYLKIVTTTHYEWAIQKIARHRRHLLN